MGSSVRLGTPLGPECPLPGLFLVSRARVGAYPAPLSSHGHRRALAMTNPPAAAQLEGSRLAAEPAAASPEPSTSGRGAAHKPIRAAFGKVQGGSSGRGRFAKLMNDADLGAWMAGADEETVRDQLMSQLQGLNWKQQELYGIWDPIDPDAGRRRFAQDWIQRYTDRQGAALTEARTRASRAYLVAAAGFRPFHRRVLPLATS